MLPLTRRDFLCATGAGLACALTPGVAFGALPRGRTRFVFVNLRGGMDGLDLLHPFGEPDYQRLRGRLARPVGGDQGLIDLDGHFGVHPAFGAAMPLWEAGELAFAPAVASPYRDRSHFDGQDMLDGGDVFVGGARDGWLNRAMQVAALEEAALTVGARVPFLVRGPARVLDHGPMRHVPEKAYELMRALYDRDAALRDGLARSLEAQRLAPDTEGHLNAVGKARTAAAYLADPESVLRIATFEFDGWDTHAGQIWRNEQNFERLAEVLSVLKDGLGEAWSDTIVIAATEFGRTVAMNGGEGTDHGTGGAAVLAGGAIQGRRFLGDWPGIAEERLFEGRDLTPTLDVRTLFAAALRRTLGLDDAGLAQVFPELPQVGVRL